jgi:hypothetical protein
MQDKKQVATISRPRDKSLQAFKDWILSLTEELSGKPQKDEWTDEEWTKHWKEFWGKSGKGKAR